MKITIVEISAKHKYRITLFGSLYLEYAGLWEPADDFLRNIGRFDE
jgi:hypothetical protein